jgi:hypothetical protein
MGPNDSGGQSLRRWLDRGRHSICEANTDIAADSGGWERRSGRPVCHALVMFDDLLDEKPTLRGPLRQFWPARSGSQGLGPGHMHGYPHGPPPRPGAPAGRRQDPPQRRRAGSPPDALRSLILATWMLGVHRIAVMQHTDCALAFTTDEDIRRRLGDDGARDAADWDFLAMPDPDADLRRDVDAVRSCSLLAPGVGVVGWRYDVGTGLIDQVIDPVGGEGTGPTGG